MESVSEVGDFFLDACNTQPASKRATPGEPQYWMQETATRVFPDEFGGHEAPSGFSTYPRDIRNLGFGSITRPSKYTNECLP